MCTLSERLKRNNYPLKVDADFLGGGRMGGGSWGSLRGNGGPSGDPNTNFGLKCPITGRCFGSSFPPLLVFWNNHCVSEKLGES